MSLLTFQIGQCGNQVGEAFYNFIAEEIVNAPPASQAIAGEAFFNYNQKNDKFEARSILIDMEPKVINECLISKKKENLWDYDKTMTKFKQEGSGNNWAFGHNMHGPSCRDDIMEMFNKQLEQADFLDTVIFFQSLAGGTGSGVGSYLLEAVREDYPDLCIMNIAVVPHLTGEVIVQNYNSTLTLSKLYDCSDAVLLVENDMLNIVCKELLRIKKPTLNDMNTVVATMLSSFLYPVLSDKKKEYYSVLQNSLNVSDLINEQLVTNPLYKLLCIKNLPQMPASYKDFSNDSWSALEKRVLQMLISNTTEANTNRSITTKSKHLNKSIANVLIARGSNIESNQTFSVLDPNYTKEIYTDKVSNSYSVIKDNHQFNRSEKSLCLISNCQAYVKSLETITQNTYRMIDARAYVYQYEKFGLKVEDFEEALAKVEQVYYNYSEL